MAEISHRARRVTAASVFAGLMVLALAAPAFAAMPWWTKGSAVATTEGTAAGYVVSGPIRMERYEVGGEKTVTQMKVETLGLRKKYPVQAHTGTCADTPVGGDVWSGPNGPYTWTVSSDRDGYVQENGHYNGIVDTTARSVVIYESDGSGTPIACANLRR